MTPPEDEEQEMTEAEAQEALKEEGQIYAHGEDDWESKLAEGFANLPPAT